MICLEAVGMRLGFDFIGVEGGVSVDSGGMFPNHLDSGFHSIVDYLLEVVGMRLGFHFIGVARGCSFSWVSIL